MAILDTQTQREILDRIQKDRSQRSQFLIQMKQRQGKGLQIAKQAAQILKAEYGVQKVVLFGSMLVPETVTPHSDIDLAVWGLPKYDLFKAGARIEQGHDFEIDLVPIEIAKPHILPGIDEGVEL